MKIAGDWLDHPGTQALCTALESTGYKALLVGGCVRNALLGVPVADIDIATDASPETVSTIAEAAGFKPVPTGIDHGTVTIVAEGRPHEVTTFRRDVETDGRRAVVAFSDRIEEDAERRDFTMNALYADRQGEVIDPLDGLPDLLARRIRFVGDAETRIREDYLRILRFFRFHAAYGDPEGGLDPEGLAACAALSAGLGTISRERITAELKKLLSARDPAPTVAAMAQSGVLLHVLPGADPRALAPWCISTLRNPRAGSAVWWSSGATPLASASPDPKPAILRLCAAPWAPPKPSQRWAGTWASRLRPMQSSPAPPASALLRPRTGSRKPNVAQKPASPSPPPT